MRRDIMTYLKIAIGLCFVAALVCEVLWLMRLDTGFPEDWPIVLALVVFTGLWGTVTALRFGPIRAGANPWHSWLLAIALVALLVWRNLPNLGPALGCDVSGSNGWLTRHLCDVRAWQMRK